MISIKIQSALTGTVLFNGDLDEGSEEKFLKLPEMTLGDPVVVRLKADSVNVFTLKVLLTISFAYTIKSLIVNDKEISNRADCTGSFTNVISLAVIDI